MTAPPIASVKGLLFDCFGTCTDWRTSITRDLTKAAHDALSANPDVPAATRAAADKMDWAAFAAEWRRTYYEHVRAVAADPTLRVKPIDEHNADSLAALLATHGLASLFTPPQEAALARAWHFLDPWPDVPAGIRALNAAGLATATLSNGNEALLRDMAAHADFAWTRVLSADMFGSFKPNPRVYLGAVDALGLQPAQCAMVASHLNDLEAAKKCGLRTIYTGRPQEEAWDAATVEQARRAGWVDIWVDIGEGADGELPEAARRLAVLQRQA